MGDHLAISGGLLQAPLNHLKTDVLRGPPGLSGGSGPSGPTVIRPLVIVQNLLHDVPVRHRGVNITLDPYAYL